MDATGRSYDASFYLSGSLILVSAILCYSLKRLNAWEIKEQSTVQHLSELCTAKLDLKLTCPLGIFKFIIYFVDVDSSKWCYWVRVLKKVLSPEQYRVTLWF